VFVENQPYADMVNKSLNVDFVDKFNSLENSIKYRSPCAAQAKLTTQVALRHCGGNAATET
jgi:hypothetical protein